MAALTLPLLWCLLWVVCAEERKEFTITCQPSEDCVLPCQFESDGKGARIMWYRKKAVVSCTRYGNTSFATDHKSPADKYKGRTGLFADQVLEGNATLLLRNVTPNDQGTYFCITMTAPRIDKSSIISLVVEAPVREVDIWFSGASVICAAEGIYPAPTLTWSTDPPTDVKLHKTKIQENKLGFFDVQSELRLKGHINSDHTTYICCVTCDTNRKTAFLKHEASVAAPVGGMVQISCSLPRSIQQSFNVTWRFGRSDPVALIIVVGQKLQVTVWGTWKSHVLSNFSASSGLILHSLKSEHQGNYTCEIHTPEETHVTWTDVTLTEDSHYVYMVVITGLFYFLVLSYVALAILAFIIFKLKQDRRQPENREEASESLNTSDG